MSDRIGRATRGTVPALFVGVTVSAPGDGNAILAASLGWLVVPLIVLALGAAAFMVYRRVADQIDQVDPEDDLPPLVFPVTARTPAVAASPTRAAGVTARPRTGQAAPPGPPPSGPPASGPPASDSTLAGAAGAAPAGTATQHSASSGSGETPASRGGGRGERTRQRRESAASARNGRARSETGPSGTDTTLQLLPGRLEVIGGEAGAEEIRFIRPAGGDAVVTLGRAPGEAPGHVRLQNPTVSRTHARLRFENGDWHIVNLSSTNPALLNGEVLPVDVGERALRDGDRLELGEVVLRYRRR
jgi:hypothetical protein